LPRIIKEDSLRESIRLDAEAALALEIQQQRDFEFALMQGPRRSDRSSRGVKVDYSMMGQRDLHKNERATRGERTSGDSYSSVDSNGLSC
jgi:hypothetical protein